MSLIPSTNCSIHSEGEASITELFLVRPFTMYRYNLVRPFTVYKYGASLAKESFYLARPFTMCNTYSHWVHCSTYGAKEEGTSNGELSTFQFLSSEDGITTIGDEVQGQA